MRTLSTMIDLTQPAGPPVTTSQLAMVVGLSVDTIRQEIAAGEIRAFRAGRGLKRKEYRILWVEARRYAAQIGAIALMPVSA